MDPRRAIAVGFLLLGLAAAARAASAPAPDAGESIYQSGVLGSGAPLEGLRSGLPVKGPDAACVNCHRPSGLGSIEGTEDIPPITGQYLFAARIAPRYQAALPYVESVRSDRDAYTETTLARAIRDGIDADGRPLSYLMPRFPLGDADMAALVGYLKTLDTRRVPGVTDTVLHFATVITPDTDPVKRQGVLDVLNQYVADKNAFPFAPSPPMRSSVKTIYAKSMYMANRHWQLHVWQLSGPASTWRAQLEEDFKREPVMAVISGLGGSNWAPVHDFCEQDHVPCLFPNVDVPTIGDHDFYSLYLSDGVLLEAKLIAAAIGREGGGPPIREVVQVYRAGDSGEEAAGTLADMLRRRGIAVHSRVLPAGQAGSGLAKVLRGLARTDGLVLWLRPGDVAALGKLRPPAKVFMSGLMGGLDNSPLPEAWRAAMRMAYPFDLPDRRVVRVDYPLGWFSFRHIPVVDERLQADTFLACGLLAETLSHMADTFVPEYLVERLQDTIDHRIITGYYPRLSLAQGQHFASKGGYIVRFADSPTAPVVADGGWTTP